MHGTLLGVALVAVRRRLVRPAHKEVA